MHVIDPLTCFLIYGRGDEHACPWRGYEDSGKQQVRPDMYPALNKRGEGLVTSSGKRPKNPNTEEKVSGLLYRYCWGSALGTKDWGPRTPVLLETPARAGETGAPP